MFNFEHMRNFITLPTYEKMFVLQGALFWKSIFFLNCRTFKGASSRFGTDRKRTVSGTGGWKKGHENRTIGFGRKNEPRGNLCKQNWDLMKLRPFTKDLYKPHPTVENR
jgi:hypothetical protein